MRLATFDLSGQRGVGVIEKDVIIDVTSAACGDMLELVRGGDEALGRCRQTARDAPASARLSLQSVRFLAPIIRPHRNIFCVGWNYREHISEAATARGRPEQSEPEVPTFFTKAPTTVIGPGQDIQTEAAVSDQVDWEGELAVIIGKGGRNISQGDALKHVFGYCVLNDVTARDLQRQHIQWFKGKSLDTFCPMGPWVVTADEVPDPQALDIETRVNGVVKQSASTGQMIFSVVALIESLSKGMTLEPGDIIATGTPSGVGFARNPPEFLRPGDVVEVEIKGVGLLRNPVVAR